MMRKITCVYIARAVDKFLGILRATPKGKEIPGCCAVWVVHGVNRQMTGDCS
jgi:hypothetical protein